MPLGSHDLKELAQSAIDSAREELVELSHTIHQNPELGFQEHRAAKLVGDTLERHGFAVERGVAGLPTALKALFRLGDDGHAIAAVAQYDALPGLGHACGHNVIASAAVGAGIGVARLRGSLPGTIVVMGCPAEESAVENAGGKVHMIKAGVFAGIDAAMMPHLATQTQVLTLSNLAARAVKFEFKGKPAHAGKAPEQGINALDGVIQTFNGINALRQHLRSDVRIHGIITHGGESPNMVPHFAACRFRVRARDADYLEDVFRKMVGCAEGAAASSGANLAWEEYIQPYANSVPNSVVASLVERNLLALGLDPLPQKREQGVGSSDFGNVSQILPAVVFTLQAGPESAGGHTPELEQAAASPIGDSMMIAAAKTMAMTVVDLLLEPRQLELAKDELARYHAGRRPA